MRGIFVLSFIFLSLSSLAQVNQLDNEISFSIENCYQSRKQMYCVSSAFKKNLPYFIVEANRKNKSYDITVVTKDSRRQFKNFILENHEILQGKLDYYNPYKYPFFKKLFKNKSGGGLLNLLDAVRIGDGKVATGRVHLTHEKNSIETVNITFHWLAAHKDKSGWYKPTREEEIVFTFISDN